MPLPAILLLLLGAVLHTTWNLVIKQAHDKYMVTWWIVVIGGLASLLALPFTGLPPRELWGFAAASVLVEAVYFLALSSAYKDHDFSLVYPIARGAAPALLALWSFLFLGERPTRGGMLGLALIIGGLLVVGVLVVRDYGESRDEQSRITNAERAIAAYSGDSTARGMPFYIMLARIGSDWLREAWKSLRLIEAWHFMNFLSFLMGVFFLWGYAE